MRESGDDRAISLRMLAEFFCWATLVSMFISRLVDGPGVSLDQEAFRCTAALVVVIGAIGLRAKQFRERQRADRSPAPHGQAES